jgi:hypothetical protein
MGMEIVVPFRSEAPAWSAIRDRLIAAGHAPSMRMIDDMPAFPDEEPESNWRDLRIGMAAGMVSLKRGTDAFRIVVWGNADANLIAARDAVVKACQEVV